MCFKSGYLFGMCLKWIKYIYIYFVLRTYIYSDLAFFYRTCVCKIIKKLLLSLVFVHVS